jgi:SAM-dependent methyltransferase
VITEQAASFRDPQGRVFFHENRVFRALNTSGESSLKRVLTSPHLSPFLKAASIVGTTVLDPSAAAALAGHPGVAPLVEGMGCPAIAEHERAPFANYAHEWSPEMLHAAGVLTIDLAVAGLADGIGLKDATPSNVMFWGAKPVFLDVLSFEDRDPHDPTWLPYAQLVRTFLLPLLVNRRFGIPLSQIFTTRRDGLEPEEVCRLLGPFERLLPRHLSLVSIPTWFGKRSSASSTLYQPRRLKNAEQARFIVHSLLRRQRRALDALRPREDRSSTWSTYTEGNNNYSSGQADAKLEAVRRALAEMRPADVLDVGCNTGVFSIVAAEAGARVVSLDLDPVVVGRLWKTATRRQLPILPLVVNLAHPTPALGWSNGECRSFLDRAKGSFDTVLMLALLHHLIVTERVPLPEIFALARSLTRRWLIVEYIDPTDSMFTRLTRGRDYLHHDLNRGAFEAVAQRYFRIVLYIMEALR